MNRTTSRITRGLVAALLALSVAPTASAASVDLRSPDAREAASAAETSGHVDLRSPDARDAGLAAPTPSPTTSSGSSGFDWGVAAVAGGGVLVVLALIGTALVSRRRGETQRSQTRVVSS